MFEIKVDTKVSLTSGATLSLTDEQNKQIKDHVLTVIFGKPSLKEDESKRAKFRYTKKRHLKRWSKEEDDLLIEIVKKYPLGVRYSPPDRKKRKEDLKQLCNVTNRKYSSVYSRYYDLGSEYKEANTWTPVAVRVTN